MHVVRDFVETLVEPLARELAARKMGLRQDPSGSRLPEDLWKQMEQEARLALGLSYSNFGEEK